MSRFRVPLFERLALASGALAALFLALIGVIIATQIAGRLAGVQIPASDDFAAWSMAASIFLALPYAMLRGDHIRVTLLLHVLPARRQRGYEVLATLIGTGLAAWAAWQAAQFVYESYAYGEVAQGMLAVPLWIPQICMPIGLALLAAMLLRRLGIVLRGGQPEETAHG